MGCCVSHDETVYEVVLDENGVARRVPDGQGTHLIYEFPDQATRLEAKINSSHLPSKVKRPESAYYPEMTTLVSRTPTCLATKKVHPLIQREKQ